jgi:hypothetical protein
MIRNTTGLVSKEDASIIDPSMTRRACVEKGGALKQG